MKWEIGVYLCKRMYLCIQKHKYTPRIFIFFLIFMKIEGILNHVNHAWIPCD